MTAIDSIFSGFRVYRRLRAGHWERWFIGSPVCSAVWLRLPHGERPGLGEERLQCEQFGGER